MLCQWQDVIWHSGWEKSDLYITWKEFKDVLDLRLETSWKHFICFIHDKESEIICFEESFLHHIMNSTWCSYNDVYTMIFEDFDVFPDNSTSYASMHFHTWEFSNWVNNKGNLEREFSCRSYYQCLNVIWGCINTLQSGNCKCTSFTGTRLSLYYNEKFWSVKVKSLNMIKLWYWIKSDS